MADGSGRSGQPGDEQYNPWAPPGPAGSQGDRDQQERQKEQEQQDRKHSVANEQTVTDFSAGTGPPPIPQAPQQPQYPAAPANPYQGGQGGYQGSSPYQGGGAYQGSSPYQGGTGPAYGYPAAPAPYGAQAPYGYGWQAPQLPNGLSVAALVLGIISMVLALSCWGSFLGIFTSVVALCLGVSARRKVARGELSGHGQATAGMVMGIIGTVLSAVFITLIIIGIAVGSDGGTDPYGVDGSSIDAIGTSAPWLPHE